MNEKLTQLIRPNIIRRVLEEYLFRRCWGLFSRPHPIVPHSIKNVIFWRENVKFWMGQLHHIGKSAYRINMQVLEAQKFENDKEPLK